MSAIDYDRFTRVLTRCAEIAADPEMPKILALVYQARAEEPVAAYQQACHAVNAANSAHSREKREGEQALAAMDGPYRVARSSVLALYPDSGLPDTLKSRRTDTDKLNAIKALLAVLDDHIGEPWADELLAGDFGTLAPATIKEQEEAIAANSALSQANTARAAAYGPAYEAYLAFKRLVRDARGPASKEYRRIHLRASPGTAGRNEQEPAEAKRKAAGATATKAAVEADTNVAVNAAEPAAPTAPATLLAEAATAPA